MPPVAMETRFSTVETRFGRVDDAISKLAEVSTDLSKILALQDHRVAQNEEGIDKLNNVVAENIKSAADERQQLFTIMTARDEALSQGFHNTIESRFTSSEERNERKNAEILNTIERKNNELNSKLERLQHTVWAAIGGGAVLSFLATVFGPMVMHALKLF